MMLGLALIATTLAGCSKAPEPTSDGLATSITTSTVIADTVFTGEHILTMDPANQGATAVAVSGGGIIFVGDQDDAQAYIGDQTRVVELGERALMPGMIDAHGHFSMMARLVDHAFLYPPPVGPVDSIAVLLDVMAAHLVANPPAEGEWLGGFGYDDSLLAEQRHPTRDDLDKLSTDIPIVLLHVSGHLAVMNTKGLESVGYIDGVEDPAGGVIRREKGSRRPNGVLEETAAHPAMFGLFGQSDPASFAAQVSKTIELYASMGITTIQDGASQPADVVAMKQLAADHPLAADLVMFPHAITLSEGDYRTIGADAEYQNGVRVGGVKFLLDGSPQGRTAWVTQPYNELPAGAVDGYTAYPAYDVEKYKQQATALIRRGVPILVHSNGDAAIDAMLDGIEDAVGDGALPDHRSVIIHAQLMRRDQLDRAKQLAVIPSFFSAHTFFWGDWHRRSFGEERASGISPTGSSIEKGVLFTTHNDSPVVPPDMLRLIWATVNRTTRSGHILGRAERVSPEQAIRSVTSDAAYQYFEEDQKGSITTGKQADLVMLSADPRSVDPMTIADIDILETIAHGNTIYRRPDDT